MKAFLGARRDVLQLLLLFHFDVLVGMHLTGVLKVGPVSGENHEEVDLQETGEGGWQVSRSKEKRPKQKLVKRSPKLQCSGYLLISQIAKTPKISDSLYSCIERKTKHAHTRILYIYCTYTRVCARDRPFSRWRQNTSERFAVWRDINKSKKVKWDSLCFFGGESSHKWR